MSLVTKVEILGEFKNLKKATDGAKGELNSLKDNAKKFGSGFKSLLGIAGIGLGIDAIVGGLKSAVSGAQEARVADQRLTAIATSMNVFGKETGTVVDRLKDYADTNEVLLGVEAETIKATQAKLFTFAELAKSADVTGGAFDRATTAAVDLAAAGFGNAEGNAVALGKALNDPVKGITALSKSGITFTDTEKKKIAALVKGNKALEAQDIILKAIETQVGGTAAATASSTDKISFAFGQVSDELGNQLLPYVDKLATWLGTEEGTQFIDDIITALKDAVGWAKDLFNWFKELNGPKVEADASKGAGVSIGGTGKAFDTSQIGKNINRSGSNMSTITYNNNYNVSAKTNANGAEIVAALKRYEKQNGRKYLY